MPRSHPPPAKRTTLPAPIAKPPTSLGPFQSTPPSFGQIVKEGIGFGAGQAIAHRAVAALLGPTTVQTTSQSSETKNYCVSERLAFESCLKIKTNEDHCNNEIMTYKQCIDLSGKSQ